MGKLHITKHMYILEKKEKARRHGHLPKKKKNEIERKEEAVNRRQIIRSSIVARHDH